MLNLTYVRIPLLSYIFYLSLRVAEVFPELVVGFYYNYCFCLGSICSFCFLYAPAAHHFAAEQSRKPQPANPVVGEPDENGGGDNSNLQIQPFQQLSLSQTNKPPSQSPGNAAARQHSSFMNYHFIQEQRRIDQEHHMRQEQLRQHQLFSNFYAWYENGLLIHQKAYIDGLLQHRGKLADCAFICIVSRMSRMGWSAESIVHYRSGILVIKEAIYGSTVALSTQESETIAMSAAARNTVAIQNFCNELGIPIPQPSTVYGDHQDLILTTTNGFGSQRSRHLSLKHHYIVEFERTGRITSRKIGTAENLAESLFSRKHSLLRNI
eukprot:g15391.t1